MTTKYLGTGITRVADVGLASGITAQHLPAGVNAVQTSGYSAAGKGPATYISDALATSSLAAAHPRFCKQSLDGRYWRLATEAGFNVCQVGALGDGTTDDTAAINAAIAYAVSLPQGGTIDFPRGDFAVSEINLSLVSTGFDKSLTLRGAGRNASRILPIATGNVLLNMMGTNLCHVEGLTFYSQSYTSQCAIFLARTTVSGNCNNNTFRDVFIEGNFTKACVVANGSESSRWFGGRMQNTNTTAKNRCLWTGGGSLVGGLQAITTINGGTVTNSNNPNTDNRMFGIEFYGPYDNANLVRFVQGVGYAFFGCTLIGGSANNTHLAEYGDPTGGRVGAGVAWSDCHFEVFGSGNVVHYLDNVAQYTTFTGLSSLGGKLVVSDGTAIVDYDRAGAATVEPIYEGWVWTAPVAPPNAQNLSIFSYALFGCDIGLRINSNCGSLHVEGYVNASRIDPCFFYGGLTRFLGGSVFTTSATALPTSGTFSPGHTIQLETPTVGQPIGWKCTVAGTLGTLNGGATTATTTSGSNVATVSSTTGLEVGQIIEIPTSSGGPYRIRKISGTTIYLDSNAGASGSGKPVVFWPAALTAMDFLEANAQSDASLLSRSNHTGTQTASTISDFTEASQDVIGAMVAAGGGSYDDASGTITLPGAAGGTLVNNGSTTINFGAFPGASDASVAITGQTGILSGSRVKAYIMAKATADHSADEHWAESIDVTAGNVVAGTGFTIFAKNTAPGSTRLAGQFTVGWEWI